MKIRIKGNSLRYRLTRPDISALAVDGSLCEQTDFIGKSLIYALTTTQNDAMTAEFIDNTITLYLPKIMLDKLVNTEIVGFNGSNGKLILLVEKDFTCLDNVAEDQSDNYPNPLAIVS